MVADRGSAADRPPGPPGPARHPTGTSLRDALLTVGGLLGVLVLVELAVPSTSPAFAASVLDAIAVTTSRWPG